MNQPPSNTVRYGIIGCGMMGQEHLRNIALLPGASVTRIFEPDDAMAMASLSLAPGAKRTASQTEVVAAADVDCLLIASPNFRHARPKTPAALAGSQPSRLIAAGSFYARLVTRATFEAQKAYEARPPQAAWPSG